MNNTSIRTIEFCIFDDETLDYFGSEFDGELQSVDVNMMSEDFPTDQQQQYRHPTNITVKILIPITPILR